MCFLVKTCEIQDFFVLLQPKRIKEAYVSIINKVYVTAVKRIQSNQSTSLCVDTSATIVQALPVYESSPSHQAYFGEGAVVGVVDMGFDLT